MRKDRGERDRDRVHFPFLRSDSCASTTALATLGLALPCLALLCSSGYLAHAYVSLVLPSAFPAGQTRSHHVDPAKERIYPPSLPTALSYPALAPPPPASLRPSRARAGEERREGRGEEGTNERSSFLVAKGNYPALGGSLERVKWVTGERWAIGRWAASVGDVRSHEGP